MPNTESTPGAMNDPCPQDTAICPPMPGNYVGDQAVCNARGCEAFTTCLPSGTWNRNCSCRPKGGGVSGAGGMGGGVSGMGASGTGAMPMGMCGNGMVEPSRGEQCESSVPLTASCMSLNMGGGVLACDPNTCMFDTSMCMSNSGGSGGMGGAGG